LKRAICANFETLIDAWRDARGVHAKAAER